MKTTRILFVCHGNICRSPMAEMIMKELLRRAHLGDAVAVDSRATSDEEIVRGVGNSIYRPAREELTRNGIPFTSHRATRLTREDYGKYDLLIGMDGANIRSMHRMLGGDSEGKIHKLLSFAGREGDVADPWYTGRFDLAYRDIMDGCRGLLAKLKEGF